MHIKMNYWCYWVSVSCTWQGLVNIQNGRPKTNKLSVALSPRANYTDRVTATCWRNLVPTFVDRRVLRGQRGRSPMVVNVSLSSAKTTLILTLISFYHKELWTAKNTLITLYLSRKKSVEHILALFALMHFFECLLMNDTWDNVLINNLQLSAIM
jgi:hypothetical protein